ncbi:uncharacterized protein BDR25DRAFT_330121 [Lindgomyces ingoldianus]|uniref:Uncharacterized protein n=1 Tax=Lindgomyces ingoldianus TaxID=673940 RepID=A0ACB6Q783_9PLEO|nr:uncharacterized protein BDR25DRAFT_330121 [Lindgomyces ingoldianus]KAF2462669.1 hypothetical protein BDR25DRAFT_330121 [Lindgomyces ingoldianus]
MSSGANSGSSTPKLPVITSPLARAPKFSPPSSRNVSPRRQPLHDRSNSQTNQYSGPTIRIVEDPGTDVYSKTPFPSQPSQILPPRNAPGYTFEGRGSRVSDSSFVTNAVANIEASHTLVPRPLHPKRAIRHSASTSTSEADTIVASSFSPSSSRFSQGTTPPSSPTPDRSEKEKGLEILEEIVSQPKRSTIRAVIPSSSSGGNPLEGHALTPRASAASLASTASTDTLTHIEQELGHKAGSPSVSRSVPKSHKHTPSSGSNKKKQASSNNTAPGRPPPVNESTESLAYSVYSYASSDRPRSSSHPSPTIHAARQVSIASGAQIHYPVIRAPSASSLWAESQELPNISSRMNPRGSQVHQWSSQLSTIHSESDRGSRSIERTSQSIDERSQAHSDNAGNARGYLPRRRQTIGSVASSDNVSSEMTEASVVVPLPLFSPITRPSDERDSDEHHDTISPLQSPPLRKQRSGYLRRWDSDSRSSSSRPGSSQSDLATFIHNTIPAWARVYYRRGERTSLGAPDSSTSESAESDRVPTAQSGRTNTPSESHFPLSIYRPRNRPHNRMSQPESVLTSEGPVEHEVYVIGPPRRGRGLSEPFTPRLRQDRRSQARLSAWTAPSFDSNVGTLFFSRQNRQILLFCLGFIFPFAWIIASVLPLPPDPGQVTPTPSQMDLEQQFDRELGPPVDDRSYQKAMWWRNLNRIMSGVGTLLIGVIIALAIVASRM